jgi:hypothetical protein
MAYELNSPPREGVYEDADITAAFDWFSEVSGNAGDLRARIQNAQNLYRQYVARPENLGNDPKLDDLGADRVASYLAQADALVRDRAAYDLALSTRIVPFVKHIGSTVDVLRGMPGAAERAQRMLRQSTVNPDSAIFELAIAVAYARNGFRVSFIPEAPPERRPDFRIERGDIAADVECKRLQRGDYEKAEAKRQGLICDQLSELVHEKRLSVHIDVTYTRELPEIPVNYLLDRVHAFLHCPIITPHGFPWKDDLGQGVIRAANLRAVHHDTANSSLYFGTKMARLLTGSDVSQGAYNLLGSGEPDERDVRYLDRVHYCSVVTWACAAEESIDARARYIRTKLSEADQQLAGSSNGIVHVGMDTERDGPAANLRRARNIEVVKGFRTGSKVRDIYLHYFLPRITETSAWSIYETTDCFGIDPTRLLYNGWIFDQAEAADDDPVAWHQQ